MIVVDENDPENEPEAPFEPRTVKVKKGHDVNEEYTLSEQLGRGKFGIVYRCAEKSSTRSLAAKFITTNRPDDRKDVEREVEIMCQLQHPRLLQLYDAFDDGKQSMCLVLELIEGGELFERVIDDDFVLTEKAVTVFMRQILEGVQFMHSKGVLHLDMKPENVLCVSRTGNRIKLIDFGLARLYNSGQKLQILFGTPEFVAPEVVNFEGVGPGTDMWAVGVICYVLLSGLSPFMGDSDLETMANVTKAEYDFDDESFEKISQQAKDFIASLLVAEIQKRPSALECLDHPWLRVTETPSPDPRSPETLFQVGLSYRSKQKKTLCRPLRSFVGSECPHLVRLTVRSIPNPFFWWFRVSPIRSVDRSECPHSVCLMIRSATSPFEGCVS